MDTESPALYEKNFLDYYFENPIKVTGEVRVTFYQKLIGTSLLHLLQHSLHQKQYDAATVNELDKVGSRGKSIWAPFCLVLLLGPFNVRTPLSSSVNSNDSYDY